MGHCLTLKSESDEWQHELLAEIRRPRRLPDLEPLPAFFGPSVNDGNDTVDNVLAYGYTVNLFARSGVTSHGLANHSQDTGQTGNGRQSRFVRESENQASRHQARQTKRYAGWRNLVAMLTKKAMIQGRLTKLSGPLAVGIVAFFERPNHTTELVGISDE